MAARLKLPLNPPPQVRSARVGAAVAVGLFLLSLVLISAISMWLWLQPEQQAALVASSYSISPRAALTDDADPKLKDWHTVQELDIELAQFQSVFWEPEDTDSLRKWISESEEISGATILEIGTGTGLVAISCLLSDAKRVVATDINPNAYVNAKYNAEHLGIGERLDVRLVDPESPGPFSVIARDEKFDLIISNPPWEDQAVDEVAAYALYDPSFGLLDAILEEADAHMSAHGKLLLAYGSRAAIQRILDSAPGLGWTVQLADDRRLEDLPEVFVPGMLLILERAP